MVFLWMLEEKTLGNTASSGLLCFIIAQTVPKILKMGIFLNSHLIVYSD